jgi:hypothetical protein
LLALLMPVELGEHALILDQIAGRRDRAEGLGVIRRSQPVDRVPTEAPVLDVGVRPGERI